MRQNVPIRSVVAYLAIACTLACPRVWTSEVVAQEAPGKGNASPSSRTPCATCTVLPTTLEPVGDAELVKWTFYLAVFTAGLAAAALAQVGLFWWQLTLMRASVRDAKQAADASATAARAAEASVVQLNENSVRELRAYVYPHIAPFWIKNADGSVVWNFSVVWNNSGESPTKDMRTHVRFDIRAAELPNTFDFDYETPDVGRALMPARSTARGPTYFVDATRLIEIGRGREHFYIYGWIRYRDVFPETAARETRFAYRVEVVGDPNTPLVTNPIPGRADLDGVNFLFRLLDANNWMI